MNYLDEMKTVMKKWCKKDPSSDDISEVLNGMKMYITAGIIEDYENTLDKCRNAIRRIIAVLLRNDCKSDSTTIFLALNDIYKAVYNEMLFETLELTHDLVRKDYGRLNEDKLVSEGIDLFSRRK